MKKNNFSLIPFAALSLSMLALMGCQKKSSEPAEIAAIPVEPALVAPSCPGVAPSGDLVADRIPGANTTRTEAGLYEGPVWINGSLYFSDFTFATGFPSRIQRLDAHSEMTTVLNDSGSNGLAVDAQGNILAGTHKFKGLSRYNIATLERTSVAEQFNGNVFNSPNDLTLAADGTIYFTDPSFQRDAAPGGQEKTGVYRVATDGTVTVVDDTMSNPNGISLSPAGDVLYVAGGGEQGVLRAYPIVNGVPQAGKDLVSGVAVPDGMAVDCLGNIYVTEHTSQRVRVFTSAGKQIATIKVDANVTNAAFGGALGKTLYLSGAGAIWKLELDVTGSPY
ncbi:MAG: SMP-30/gluconolactonase/LRE family protein [Pseudomonadota bacterium]